MARVSNNDVEEGKMNRDDQAIGSNSNSTNATVAASESPSKGSYKSSDSPKMVMSVDRETLRQLAEISLTSTRVHDDEDEEDDDYPTDLQHMFCFSCCDIRRGAMILNFIFILVVILTMVYYAINLREPMMEDLEAIMDDDDNIVMEDNYWSYFRLTLLRNGIAVFFALVFGIGGAYKFNKWAVLIATLWYFVYMAWGAYLRRHIGAIGGLIMVYPNMHLFWILRNGKITRENYATREKCCAT